MSAVQVTVDYDAISANVEILSSRASRADVMAVVKADGYGHGLIPTAQAARQGGATWLGTAQAHEAILLRDAGDQGRILTWLYAPQFPLAEVISRDIDVSCSSREVLEAIAAGAGESGKKARVHLCVDTGLGREGVTPQQLPALAEALKKAQNQGHIEVVGIWSHFAWADQPGHSTIDAQAATFRAACESVDSIGLEAGIRHLANSAATLTRPDDHFDMVRPGLAVYGVSPVKDPDGKNFGLTPAMSVSSRLALVKRLPAGHGVSYGHDYVAANDTTVGLLPVGYADGIFRQVSGRATVSVAGMRHPIVGRICMDQCVIDLGPETDVRAGDEVVLMGTEGPTAGDWADAADTIDYDVLVRFGTSMQRESRP